MTSSDADRRVLRDAIDILRLRDDPADAVRVDRLEFALTDHANGDCPAGGRGCAAVAAAREVLETIE